MRAELNVVVKTNMTYLVSFGSSTGGVVDFVTLASQYK